MPLLVQKYGGSSLADVGRIGRVADRVARARAAGNDVVVVVSAMGNTTNELLALAREVSQRPGRRELDMLISVGERVSMALLAMALHERGHAARSFTGSQSGILTDESHANARVIEVRPDRVRESIARGEVAIVAGFQGVSRAREVTTLGRGGSDTTAVVLAAALGADECEICSDVDGVWSADPRAVPGATRIDALSLDEGLALARNGAKVLYEEAVAWARVHGVVLRASATASDGGGTVLASVGPSPDRIVAVTSDVSLARVSLAEITALPPGSIRYADAAGALVDLRNVHGTLPGAVPAATVAAIGARAGSNPKSILAILEAAGPVSGWRADADAVVLCVDPETCADTERRLHRALLEAR